MDALKNLLQKRKNEPQSSGWVKRGDIEKKQEEQRLLDQQKQQELEKQKKQKKLEELEQFYTRDYSLIKKQKVQSDSKDDVKKEGQDSEQQKDQPQQDKELQEQYENQSKEELEQKEPPMSKYEVIRNLRKMGSVVTYFGEDNWQRYKRMIQISQQKINEDFEEKREGNTFLMDNKISDEDYNRSQNLNNLDLDENEKLLLQKINDFKPSNFDEQETNIKITKIDKGKEKDDTKNYQNKCEETFIWIKRMLLEWEKFNDQVDEKSKQTVEFKKEVGQYRQCRRYLIVLLDILKKNSVSTEILNGLYLSVLYTYIGDYVQAHNRYLTLAIGNAPWPMGVTMVGIHDRSGRSNIFSSKIAHILNDETQRKYLQAFKRLLSICQKVWPSKEQNKQFIAYQ